MQLTEFLPLYSAYTEEIYKSNLKTSLITTTSARRTKLYTLLENLQHHSHSHWNTKFLFLPSSKKK